MLGLDAAARRGAGLAFYAGLWLALLVWVLAVVRADEVPRRAAIAAIAGAHLLFALAPPLLSQDVFSYLAYARLETLHGLDAYAVGPSAAGDHALRFAGSRDAPAVYGPAFMLALRPLGGAALPVGFWLLKVVAAASSLAAVALVGRAARRRGTDPVRAAVFLGLNPVLLVHVVGGAHNDAVVMLGVAAAALAAVAGRAPLAAALGVGAAAVKASGAVVAPFVALGGRDRRAIAAALLAAAGAAALVTVLGLAAYGQSAFAWIATLTAHQAEATSFSVPEVTAKGVAAILGAEPGEMLPPVRLAFLGAFGVVVAALLWRTWRGADPIAMAGWATLALLVCSAWLVPWYVAWLLPLAAVAMRPRLATATVVLTAWTLAIAIPF